MDCEEVQKFANANDTNIYIYSGDITESGADKIISKVAGKTSRRSKCALVISTFGGDPNAAYRISRALKRAYGEYTIYVFGFCKSAGTLIALGAKEIVMTELGELGPLDIQMPREDELDNESGLIYSQALATIKAHAFDFFETCYLDIKTKSGGTITTKTASSIATELAIGIFSPLAQQIDPLKVGEVTRAMEITRNYGTRLTENHEALDRLIHGYANHGFVIDYEEAKLLFGEDNVRGLTQEEAILGAMCTFCRTPRQPLFVECIDEIFKDSPAGEQKGDTQDESQQVSHGSDQGTVAERTGDRCEGLPEGSLDPTEQNDSATEESGAQSTPSEGTDVEVESSTTSN